MNGSTFLVMLANVLAAVAVEAGREFDLDILGHIFFIIEGGVLAAWTALIVLGYFIK